jgi:ribonuclease BN (tRNA processing enzyme)
VVDLGPGTLPELRRHADFRELDAVVLSHLHLDHMLDVLALRYALAYNPVPPRQPLPLWLPPGGLALLQRLATALTDIPDGEAFFAVFSPTEYDPEAPLPIGNLTVRFHPTVHYVPCWAVRVSDGHGGDLFYTADTGPSANLVPFAEGCEVVVAEGTIGGVPSEPFASRGHLTPAEAGQLAREVGASLLVLAHVWSEQDPFAAVRAAAAAFDGPVELATPGLQVAWNAPAT